MAGSASEEDQPEISLARRAHKIFQIKPPIPVERILKEYADVEYDNIPFNVDAICVGLKRSGTRPQVIVNRRGSKERCRFTLAHELGHVLIPWHMGLILDEIHVEDGTNSDIESEVEANRFASEFLMPSDWVRANFDALENPHEAVRALASQAQVSIPSAVIKIKTCAAPGLVFADIVDGVVVSSGRSNNTAASGPGYGSLSRPAKLFPNAAHHSFIHGDREHHWWTFESTTKLTLSETDDWREILSSILGDFVMTPEERNKFRASINGVISGRNSMLREQRAPEPLYDASMQRFYSLAQESEDYRELTRHPRFDEFVRARVGGFFK